MVGSAKIAGKLCAGAVFCRIAGRRQTRLLSAFVWSLKREN